MFSGRKKDDLLKIPWTMLDIAFVFLISYTIAISLIVIFYFTLEKETSFKYFRYLSPYLMIFIPYLWIKKKYDMTWKSLGLKKGNFSILQNIVIGIAFAVLILLLVKLIPFWNLAVFQNNSISINNYLSIIIVPFTLFGFTSYILSPLGEEIFFRGFVYKCLLKKMGLFWGIICQALFSTAIHFSYLLETSLINFFSWLSYMFFSQVILGILYEKTDSIYPPTICHCLFNYLIFLHFS